ncbi:Aste57867_14586 [Aphanomyces stellatus]|uniref:Aste57867_14586 protein n=1 Tax=Aphanomyces stellatus TaxID=120398 RepID=A0A485L133_9STRA|nr:hypothetical protein As57867_014532 [Aphanomyces stellatus]VFT91405.1 Aste57867_14586 [Aphanomyces stellatus]
MEPNFEFEPTTVSPTPVDLFIVCDTTGSMGNYIVSLGSTIRQILPMLELLFQGRVKLHVVSYKDYCDAKHGIITHCGQRTHTNEELLAFAANLGPIGGGDYPEAVKTALNFTLHQIDTIRETSKPAESKSLVIIYTDAPPHHALTESDYEEAEENAITANSNYRAGYDWISICNTFKEAQVPVYTFHSVSGKSIQSILFYDLLGPVVPLRNTVTTNITKATIGLLMHLMGCDFDHNESYMRSQITFKEQLVSAMPMTSEAQLPLHPKKHLDQTYDPFLFDVLPYMREDLSTLPLRFKSNVAFQDTVYAVLDDLFTPANVLALTYNPILGKLWRLVSARRLDPRLASLSTKLSTCVPNLAGDEKAQLQKWLEESFDQGELIRETIESTGRAVNPRPCLVLEAGTPTVAVDDLRSLSRSPNPGVIKSVQSILTHLQRVPDVPNRDQEGSENTPRYLPLDLPNAQLFSFLAHLVHDGVTFSTRGAAIMAMLCALSDHAFLKDRAETFLASIQGTWIPLDKPVDFPEVLSLEFVKLAKRGSRFLTESEATIFTQLWTISRLRLAATKPVEVTLGFVPSKKELRPDQKTMCGTCGYLTSLTLMATTAQCGLCAFYGVDEAKVIQSQHEVDPTRSHMVECRGCHGLYAIVQLKLLNIDPKCHFCRTGVVDAPPKVECLGCLNQFLDPAGLLKGSSDTWQCAVCVTTPEAARTVATVSFHELLEAYPTWTRSFGLLRQRKSLVNVIFFDRHVNYFKLFTQHHKRIFPEVESHHEIQYVDPTTIIFVHGKRVHQVPALLDALVDDVLHGSLSDVCNLCFEDHLLPALESACGRCNTQVCGGCLSAWYGEVQPGRLILQTHLTCAFCRRHPKGSTLKKFNKAACALFRSGPDAMDTTMYYGWCVRCYQVKPMVARECAQDVPLGVTNFACTECQVAEHPTDINCDLETAAQTAVVPGIQQCPGCDVPTIKAGGCNHITCICGQHWCYVCGQGFHDEMDTYEHLYVAHSGADY